jgi:hypothetical protein
MKQATFEKQTKRKITSGASVITSKEVVQILKEKENLKNIPKHKITKKKLRKNFVLREV